MAHFAELDNDDKVIRVIVVDNDKLFDSNNHENEEIGIAYCKSLYGESTKWVQTSFNKTFRKNFAQTNDLFDEENDAFIAPQPYPSWILNNATFVWEAPVSKPNFDKYYKWNEENLSWDEVE